MSHATCLQRCRLLSLPLRTCSHTLNERLTNPHSRDGPIKRGWETLEAGQEISAKSQRLSSPPDTGASGNIFRPGRSQMSWASGTSFDPPAAGLVSPQQTSPSSTSPGGADEHVRKRKRSEHATENGDAEGEEEAVRAGSAGSPQQANGNGKPRHQPGVKRACNDCRQQKVCTALTMTRGCELRSEVLS